jgi:hypothetical protein
MAWQGGRWRNAREELSRQRPFTRRPGAIVVIAIRTVAARSSENANTVPRWWRLAAVVAVSGVGAAATVNVA